jgi:hypothetical protein
MIDFMHKFVASMTDLELSNLMDAARHEQYKRVETRIKGGSHKILTEEEKEVARKNKIQGIKFYQNNNNIPLHEAKIVIEQFLEQDKAINNL